MYDTLSISVYCDTLSIIIFYTLICKCILMLLEYEELSHTENDYIYEKINMDYLKYNLMYNNDLSISKTDKIDILDNFLMQNKYKKDSTTAIIVKPQSLNKSYIEYFIFQKHGTFYASINGKMAEAFNSYDEFCFWNEYYNGARSRNGNDNNFSLDDPKIYDVCWTINENEYITTDAQINFISWLYYSGLYDYLMQNIDIKKHILDEMNTKMLLTGNNFLKYQLFLNEYNYGSTEDEAEEAEEAEEDEEDPNADPEDDADPEAEEEDDADPKAEADPEAEEEDDADPDAEEAEEDPEDEEAEDEEDDADPEAEEEEDDADPEAEEAEDEEDDADPEAEVDPEAEAEVDPEAEAEAEDEDEDIQNNIDDLYINKFKFAALQNLTLSLITISYNIYDKIKQYIIQETRELFHSLF